uniref:Clustered mitochondria protein homolog n=1 Tax=Callorhinchus milii TaxID=7868 RepID=A0A4W3J7C7_CALMI
MKPDGEEVIPDQDLLNIKIQVTGSDAFDLQVSPQELVQEIIQVLMDREDTCHRTCFSLQHRGNILDNFSELSSVKGLGDGSVLKVVEEPYTAREARIHIRHIRDLLKSLDLADAYNGMNCNSLSFLTEVSEGDAAGRSWIGIFDAVDCSPPEYILPGSKDRLLSPLQPPVLDNKSVQCLKALMLSGWNPPPGNRRMHGDLMYLYVITMEKRHVSLTASTRGFYINQSTMDVFNPKPASPSLLCHSLVELLSQISPAFKKNFTALQKKRVQCHPLKRIATPYQLYSWTTPHSEHTIDCVRAEDAFTSRLGYEEHIPGQTRDWNEELQTTRELPREVLTQRLQRERAMFKVNSDFVAAATRGAMAIIDGNVMAINPGEEVKMQMFIWNSIFFSLGFDVRDHYKDFGGDCAAYVASGHDLKGVRAFSLEDTSGLYTLGTVVLDYRGYRVTAQSIIPGILEREQEQSVVYGSVDFGKTVMSNHQYVDLLLKSAKALCVQKHLVLNEHDQPVLLCSSVECKGIVGNDGRFYILDLLRTFPPDLNFLPVEGEEMPEECRRWGFPRQYRHKLCSFRPELLERFVQHKYTLFTKLVKEKMKESDSMQNEKCSALKAACRAVGSVNDVVFDIRFNPNMYSSGVRFHELENEAIVIQKRLLRDAAAFLVAEQIPSFITDCLRHKVVPADGVTMTDALHRRGINIRYIGTIAQLVSQSEERQRLDHIMVSRVGTGPGWVITRAATHILTTYLQGVEMSGLSSAVSRFLNCLLSSYPNPVAHLPPDELVSRRKKSKRKLRSPGAVDTAWSSLAPCELWRHINSEAYFPFSAAVERFGFQKVSLLREFCIKAGIQILLRDYSFDSRHKPTFTEEDVLNIFPVAKHVSVRATDGERIYQSAKEKVEKGNLTEGFELLTEALNQFNNVYGAMHPDMCDALHLLARLHYLKGDVSEAVNHQQKTVIMSERTRGFDHPRTTQEYISLALYSFANSQVCVALKLLYRARYLTLTVSGEDHPAMAVLDSSIGLVLQAVLECDLALRFLQKALEINLKYFGLQSLQTALSYHLLAQVCASKAEFLLWDATPRGGTLYKCKLFHQQTRVSSEFLKHVTQQAVNLQRTMNEIYQNGSGSNTNTNLPLVQVSVRARAGYSVFCSQKRLYREKSWLLQRPGFRHPHHRLLSNLLLVVSSRQRLNQRSRM